MFHSCPSVVPTHPFVFPPCLSPAKLLQNGSRAGKPELRVFVFIRVHSWIQTDPSRFLPAPPRQSCFRMDLGLESPSYIDSCFIRVHSWFQTTPAFLLRLSVSIRVHPWRTSLIPPWPRTCSRNSINRSRAGKPDLHLFVSIRVHSWFQTPCIRLHSWFQTTPSWFPPHSWFQPTSLTFPRPIATEFPHPPPPHPTPRTGSYESHDHNAPELPDSQIRGNLQNLPQCCQKCTILPPVH